MAYDDAYWSYGWTAQSLGNSYDGAPISMPPAGLIFLPVTGAWYAQNGKPDWGRLTFVPSVPEVFLADKTITLETIHLTLQGGQIPAGFGVLSPDTSNSVSPAVWTWEVTGRIGPVDVNWTIAVPNTSSTVFLGASAN